MKTLSIDIESRSSVDLSKCGVYKYAESPDFDILLFGYAADGGEIHFGNSGLKVLEVPGHSRGSVALYSECGNFVMCGDALFCGSIGRTDLPGGNCEQLLESIREKLFTLNRDCGVMPGHGGFTTIGHEIDTNPFF